MIEAPVSTMIEYAPKNLPMLKYFSQMTEQEQVEIRKLEYDDEGLFQELGKVNRPLDYVVKAIQNNEHSSDSKTIAGFIPTEESAQFYLVNAKVLIFNNELMFLSSPRASIKQTPRLMFLRTRDGLQGSNYFDELLITENEDDRVYIDLPHSLEYGVSVAGKSKKNEKEKHYVCLK